MVDAVLALPEDTQLMILAPVVANRKGEHVELFEQMQAQGFIRFRVRSGGGTTNEGEAAQIYDVESLPKLKKNDKHTIDVVVDRLKGAPPTCKQRLAESFETALRLADGRAVALEMDTGHEHLFSSKFACPVCSYSLPELEPRLFSFNNPMGACPDCDGLGQITFFDPKRVVAHPVAFARRAARSRAGTGATSSTSRCCKAWRPTTTSTSTRRSRSSRKESRSCSCSARARRRSRSPI